MSGMKKYYGLGLLALLTTAYMTSSCSHDDYSSSMLEAKAEAFNEAFIETYGTPNPQHTWGFGGEGTTRAFTRANYGETYPATHEYTDAYGTVIAGANMNHNMWADPYEYYGGWLVPDPLTPGQKERVRLYFQANPDLSYEDPHFRHFFVQQVYTGGTSAPTTGNHESTTAADGHTSAAGMKLNQLTVGEACSHINNFNAGTCSPSPVLDNGSYTNNGTYHNDQITLMVNVFDTSCFGYHETDGSNVQTSTNHNDKMALVSAEVIDAWAAQNGNPGEAVVDKWNRSFMGFDYEFLPESDIVMDSYALLSQVPNINNLQYAWDGEKVMTLGPAQESTGATEREEFDITQYFAENSIGTNVGGGNVDCNIVDGKIVCTFTNQYYNSITFKQRSGADWTPYDKLVIEFNEPSPVALTLGCNGEAAIAVGATSVEVATVNYVYDGNGGPAIYGGTGSTEPVTLVIKKVTLVKEATTGGVDNTVYYNPTYLLGDADNQKVAFYKDNTNMYGGIIRQVTEDEMKTTQDGKTCLNLKLFQDLVADGYHPINSTLKDWVKWQAACDGYYSDWIVTLTEAQRISDNPSENYDIVYVPRIIDGRIFCEDLGSADRTDIDYNDVVFDAFTYVTDAFRVPYTLDTDNSKVYNWDGKRLLHSSYEKTDINLLAAGGTIDITVAGEKVHKKMDIEKTVMANTYVEGVSPKLSESYVENEVNPYKFTVNEPSYANLGEIPILVKINDEVQELTAYKGEVPQKFCAPVGTPWAVERKEIKDGLTLFKDWVENEGREPWYKLDDGQANLYNLKFVSNSEVNQLEGTSISGYDIRYWEPLAMKVGEGNQITITLNEALKEGDQIAITAYRENNENTAGTLYVTCNGQTVAQTQEFNNISYDAKPNTFIFPAPSAMHGQTTFQLSKDTNGAEIYITGITVIGGLNTQIIGY